MTAAARAGARDRAPADLAPVAPPRPNWQAAGVVVAVLVHLGGAVWFAAGVDRRVSALEASVPPGSIQRLDERTLQIQRALERLEARR